MAAARRIKHGIQMGLALLLLSTATGALAQYGAARVLLTAPIDERRLVRLAGNTRPEANAANDRGAVPDTFPLEHMLLLLRRPAEREQALDDYIAQLYRRGSPWFHHWLTAAQFGQRFGLAPQDIATVSVWLRQHGFTVNAVYANNLLIDFSGTEAALSNAFHTQIHALDVHGIRHIANMGDPQIPAALAPAIAGIVSLHDFRPHPTHVPRVSYYISSTGAQAVVPADLATIYNLNPLFAAGVTGTGQTVVVIEDTNVYKTTDWSTFRSTFGLSGYTSGSFTQVHPTGSYTCTNPGMNADQGEAILDAEWASAAAPNAAIELASCADTSTTFGGLFAVWNLVNGASPPSIMSISYAECEAFNGQTNNQDFSSAFQQAVTEGVSVFVAAGDWGGAVCDADDASLTEATHGLAVNGFASTPYNVAVGGTDFGDSYAGTTSTYWSTTNSTVYGSALSYVPEIPWNYSCASVLISSYLGYAATYGSAGLCNSSTASADGLLNIIAGSGGPSRCATGAASTTGVVSGSCAGTPKPAWQAGVPGNPADGVRDLPDVSLFASNGVWGHYYIFCWSNTKDYSQDGAASCTGAPSTWSGAGGTSFAAPILAGIQALVNQSTGAAQGNPNPVYYILATSQSAAGLSCNATSGNQVASGCVFHDVTLGDMDVDCFTPYNCYLPSGTYGVLSTSNSSYAKAFGATAGWDFATGLGSVNAANLVKYWTSSDLSLSGSGTVTASGLLSYSLTVGNHGPQSASVVVATVLPAGFTLITAASPGCSQSGQTVTCSAGTLAVNSSASLTVVVQPGTPETVSLVFTASSGNADLNPADGSTTISLNWNGTQQNGASEPVSSDGPLPLWSYVALGLLLFLIAQRRSSSTRRSASERQRTR